jgi:hypothetical protein
MKKKVLQMTSELQKHTSSKAVGGVVSEEWLLRVILTAPHVSGRALAEAFHLVVGSDANMISRESIGKVRSAFVEMWKALILSTMRDFIGVHLQAATSASGAATRAHPADTGDGTTFVCIFMSHVQDEAELRLLTSDPGSRPGLPRRSRTSKVQLHVVRVSCQGKSWAVPTELEALADKSAATLATSFEALLVTLIKALLPGSQQEGRHRRLKAWLIHALIGDGIATNEAAAKILLALASEGTSKPLIERVKKLSRHPMANSDHSLTTSD